MQFDYIIVGGGTAGCVLARRLSERSGNRVLLLEAGQDVIPGQEPADILSRIPESYDNPAYRWLGLEGYYLTSGTSPSRGIFQARVLGGGSSIMGMMALRGSPDDYDGWRDGGADGWGWNEVLPYFRKLETDLDFAGKLHGQDGPTAIRRTPVEEWPPIGQAALAYARRDGLDIIPDMNGAFGDGIGPTPIFGDGVRRSSSSICYLPAPIRRRDNLRIITNALVERVNFFDGGQVIGVTARVDGKLQDFSGSQVILSAGGLLSPILLMRSGIGPADVLRKNGIAVRVACDAVGANLQNHASIQFAAQLRPGARRTTDTSSEISNNGMLLRVSSTQGCGDLAIAIGNRLGRYAMAERLASFTIMLLKPQSTGQIVLDRGNPQGFSVEYNLAGASSDVARLIEGYRFLFKMLQSEEMRAVVRRPIMVTRWDKVFHLNAPTTFNKVRLRLAAALNDGAPALAERVFASIGTRVDPLRTTDAALDHLVRTGLLATAHHSGTCRMGSPDDPSAVVDNHGLVRNTKGLRVVDASVIPSIPRGNTNLPVLMIAERMSDLILSEA